MHRNYANYLIITVCILCGCSCSGGNSIFNILPYVSLVRYCKKKCWVVMSVELQGINNIRVLRAMARELSIEQLEEILEKIKLVIGEKREQENCREREKAERQEKLKTWLELMQADGIDPNELLKDLAHNAPRKRAPRAAKYRYIDADGSEKTWTGQGRTPKAIADAMAQGKSMESFLIN